MAALFGGDVGKATPLGQVGNGVSFGPFDLFTSERLLAREGVPVELGGRTLDLLIALLSKPNEILSKKDLIALVWPETFVDEGSLRVQIAGLRKALGDGKNGARYIETLAGRGYCFVAPVSRANESHNGGSVATANFLSVNLPNRLTSILGRDEDILKLSAQLIESRFVTIVGPGGIGKTTVVLAVAHDLNDAFARDVLFVDLSLLSDPRLVTTAIASMLGLPVGSDNARSNLISHLRDRKMLLILDTCEHLVEPVADLATSILEAAPQVHILATSREALRIEGEYVYKLGALACPHDAPGITAEAIQSFPATQLFMERAAASGANLEINDADAAIVGEICRKLDGVPLAIELAAGRVEAFGLQQTAALLDKRLTLLWRGRRTVPPRQQTLRATLDWSYGLLSERERLVLRRLAVFVGPFTIEAALAVVTSAAVDESVVFGAIDGLVAKSMVATRPAGAMMRYRLMDTPRAYVLEIGSDDVELPDVAVRHATYYRRWLEQAGNEWSALTTAADRALYLTGIGNVRAALEWCFGADGNPKVGVELASAATPVFSAMSLLAECRRWAERAILALDETTRGGAEEIHLQAALGTSLIHTHGICEAARASLDRSVAIAEERGNVLDQLRILGPLHALHSRIGDFKTALHYARRSVAIAKTVGDPAASALAHSFLGNSLHHAGDLSGARIELEAALSAEPAETEQAGTIYFGVGHRYTTAATLARILWLQGHPVQAVERIHQTVAVAASLGLPGPLSAVLSLAVSVFLWTGDLKSAEEHTAWFISVAQSHSLGPFLAIGHGFEGELAIRQGAVADGIAKLQTCLEEFRKAGTGVSTTPFSTSLIQGFVASGRFIEGLTTAEESIQRVEKSEEFSCLPELLRLKGTLLLAAAGCPSEEAEGCFRQSLGLSRRQGALSWELRAATNLAALWHEQGRTDVAYRMLSPVYGQFTEGFDTSDLKIAKRLLDQLG